MQRRQVLAAASALFVAGCTGPAASGPDGDGTTPGGGTRTTTSSTATETTSGAASEVSYEDTEFSVTDSGCGVVAEDASVAFDTGESTVTVTGTVSGANACYSARLADAAYDPDADRFEVVVETYQATGDGCAQCITEIDYEATASFSGGVPGRVVVVHRSRGGEREVASAEP